MSQDIEIDPDSRTIKYYEKPTVESIKEHLDVGGLAIGAGQARALLDEIDRLRNESAKRNQAAMDISDENDRLRKENTSLNQSAKSLAHVNHQLQKELFDQNQVMNELFQKAERLEKLIPPEPERGPGFVGQGSWSVFAEKVVAERDEARDELSNLCEDIRVLKEDYDDFKSEADERIQALIKDNRAFADDNAALTDDNRCLHEKVKRLGEKLAAKKEHASIDTDGDEIHAISGYGSFRLTRTTADNQWSLMLNEDKVALYNRKGRRVRAKLADW